MFVWLWPGSRELLHKRVNCSGQDMTLKVEEVKLNMSSVEPKCAI